jgi:hypothetical protein
LSAKSGKRTSKVLIGLILGSGLEEAQMSSIDNVSVVRALYADQARVREAGENASHLVKLGPLELPNQLGPLDLRTADQRKAVDEVSAFRDAMNQVLAQISKAQDLANRAT